MSRTLTAKIAIISFLIIIVGGLVAGLIFALSTSSGRSFIDGGFGGVFNSMMNFVEAPINGFIHVIKDALTKLWDDLTGSFTNAGNTIKNGATSLWNDTFGRL